jgi:hypothetical protein
MVYLLLSYYLLAVIQAESRRFSWGLQMLLATYFFSGAHGMNKFLLVGCLLFLSAALAAAPPVAPYERAEPAVPETALDKLVLARLVPLGIAPAHPCSDEVFIRRVYLDVIGTMPEAAEVRNFLKDPNPAKRAMLIDTLLKRPEFDDYWTLKWCDLLRVKSEFPINLWPNAVQAYQRWIRDAIHQKMPLDSFARILLTANGSNFRVGPANFCRAVQDRAPATIASAAALTFMGSRFERWPADRRAGMAAFFSRVSFKKTGEWKEEIVYLDPTATQTLRAMFPDGQAVQIPTGQDPREVFADWLTAGDNPWFTTNLANRSWAWLMGRGIIHEPDDIRPDNPPSNPELLAYLEQELVKNHFDQRAFFRVILNSRTYQQSSIPQSTAPKAEALFAFYPVRRLDAEVLMDALCHITGSGEVYTSMIPEPYTVIPSDQRTITLADGSITSPFLELFGRPARDTGLETERSNQPSSGQRLHMLNSSSIQKRTQTGPRLRRFVELAQGNHENLVRLTYLTVMSRQPTAAELSASLQYFSLQGNTPLIAEGDLVWALFNTREFLYRH